MSEPVVATRRLRVVLVDSREERRKLMVDVVEGVGDRACVVAVADSCETARLAVDEENAEAVVLDLHMPTAEGLRTVRHLRRKFPALAIVVCSFDLDAATIHEALLMGADSWVPKPASPYELLAALEEASRPPIPTGDGTRLVAAASP